MTPEIEVMDGPPPHAARGYRTSRGPWFTFADQVRKANGRWVRVEASTPVAARATIKRLRGGPPSPLAQRGEIAATSRGAFVWAALIDGDHYEPERQA